MARLTLLCTILALAAAGPAFGGNIAVTLGLSTGALSIQAPQVSASAGKTLQIPLTVADGRGNGAGWTLLLDSAKSVTITSITARCAPGSTCTLPHAVGGPNGSAILKVAHDSGMGVMQLVVTVAPLAPSAASVPLSFSVA